MLAPAETTRGSAVMVLKPLQETCIPREEVRSGTISAVDFAARLEQVVADPGTYADYGDPSRFFSLTYPTSGMKRLLTSLFGRLSDQALPGAENPVLRFQTSFGGGKTHGLIAAYHVGRGFRPGPEFFDSGFDESRPTRSGELSALNWDLSPGKSSRSPMPHARLPVPERSRRCWPVDRLWSSSMKLPSTYEPYRHQRPTK